MSDDPLDRPGHDLSDGLSSPQAVGWLLAGAKVTGRSHVTAGADCDDAWYCGQSANGFAIGVVSDGAGSALHGGLGAAHICAVLSALETDLTVITVPPRPRVSHSADASPASPLSPFDWTPVLRKARSRLVKARKALQRMAKAQGGSVDDYLATLVCAIAHPDCGALILHIGDGAASVFDEDGGHVLTSQPENGEYLNQTYFLVEDDWEIHCRTLETAEIRGHSIFLMTDGVTDLAYHREGRELRPAPGFFTPLTSFLTDRPREARERGLHGMLSSERADAMVDDDKTIVWMKFGGNDEHAA